MKRLLEQRGPDFAESELSFVEQALGSDAVVAMCKAGRTGLFISALEYHLSEWDRLVRAGKEFEESERTRVSAFREQEQGRVESERAAAQQKLMVGAAAFGLFMLSVAPDMRENGVQLEAVGGGHHAPAAG